MAKKRKGAKEASASRSKPKKAKQSSKKRPVKPVSPAPRKTAPKKGRTSKKARSRAAVRGWETRRRDNPLRWASKAIAKKRKALKTLKSSTNAIEREWRSLERKALKQQKEAEAAGGIHPDIAKKLGPIQEAINRMEEMKTMIRTFNSPMPDQWELEAYNYLERFISIRDSGAATAQQMKEAHAEWYAAKRVARKRSKDWPAWMAMIGSVLGLPMHGTFSVDSFVTS
jgi:hypothetical protein